MSCGDGVRGCNSAHILATCVDVGVESSVEDQAPTVLVSLAVSDGAPKVNHAPFASEDEECGYEEPIHLASGVVGDLALSLINVGDPT